MSFRHTAGIATVIINDHFDGIIPKMPPFFIASTAFCARFIITCLKGLHQALPGGFSIISSFNSLKLFLIQVLKSHKGIYYSIRIYRFKFCLNSCTAKRKSTIILLSLPISSFDNIKIIFHNEN